MAEPWPWTDLKIASYNFGAGSDARKLNDLNFMYWIDVVGCQEASDRKGVINDFLAANPTWGQYKGHNKAGHDAVPILYNRATVQILGTNTRLTVPKVWVGPKGAGPTHNKPKVVHRIYAIHKPSGRRFHFLNHHLIPSATRRNLPAREKQARMDVFRRQVDGFVAEQRGLRSLVFGAGDWNAEPNFPPMRALTKAGLRYANTAPTHRKRRIDLLVYKAHPAVRVQYQATLNTTSDHRMPVVLYRIKSTRR